MVEPHAAEVGTRHLHFPVRYAWRLRHALWSAGAQVCGGRAGGGGRWKVMDGGALTRIRRVSQRADWQCGWPGEKRVAQEPAGHCVVHAVIESLELRRYVTATKLQPRP